MSYPNKNSIRFGETMSPRPYVVNRYSAYLFIEYTQCAAHRNTDNEHTKTHKNNEMSVI